MSKIKNDALDQYGPGCFEQQQFGTAGVEGVNRLKSGVHHDFQGKILDFNAENQDITIYRKSGSRMTLSCILWLGK